MTNSNHVIVSVTYIPEGSLYILDSRSLFQARVLAWLVR